MRRKEASDVEPTEKKGCCSPCCWLLWGLLGLAALVLGLLFGLGVIGNWHGPDLDANLGIGNLNINGEGNLNSGVNGTIPGGAGAD